MQATAETQGTTIPIVYVVDDEELISRTLALILNTSGFRALGFTGAADALRSAEIASPDLLIADVLMPEMNGIELAIRFRSTHPGCKILLFSGQSVTSSLLETARKQGHDFNILARPVHPTDMLAAIGKLI